MKDWYQFRRAVVQTGARSERVRSNLKAICKLMVGSYLKAHFELGAWQQLMTIDFLTHVTRAQSVVWSSPFVGRRFALVYIKPLQSRCRFATGQQWLPAAWVWLVLWWTLRAARMQALQILGLKVLAPMCCCQSHGWSQGRALVIFVPCSVRSISATLLQVEGLKDRLREAGKWYAAYDLKKQFMQHPFVKKVMSVQDFGFERGKCSTTTGWDWKTHGAIFQG